MKKHILFTMSILLIFSGLLKSQDSIVILNLKFTEVTSTKMVTSLSDKDRDVLNTEKPARRALIIISDIDHTVTQNWACNDSKGKLDKERKSISFDVTGELSAPIRTGETDFPLNITKDDPNKTVYKSITVKWTALNPKGVEIATKEEPIIIGPPYQFLPNASDYDTLYKKKYDLELRKNYDKNLSKEFNQKIKNGNEYRITYDFKNRKLDYPAPWLGGKNKKVANLNRNIVFEVVNINPLIHHVTINNTVVNRNTELESEFLKRLAIPVSGESKGTVKAQSGSGKTIVALSNEEKLLQSFDTLAAELQLFYDKKIADPSPDLGLYKEELEFIKGKIHVIFDIKVAVIDKKSILEKGAGLIAKVKGAEINKTYVAAVQNSGDLMEKLDNINYTIASNAIEPGNNDEIDFNVSIKKGDVEAVPPANYSVMIAGGFKADFSIGFYLTGLIDDLYTLQSVTMKDTTFYINPHFQKTDSILNIQNVDKQKIIKDDKGKNYIGMMILSHFYPRTGYRFNVSLTTGFGIDPGLNARYLLGGSLLLGYEKRIVISGGCIWGNTKTLASGLKEGQYYTGSSSQLQKDVFNHSWFVSVSFNIGSVPLSGNSTKKQ